MKVKINGLEMTERVEELAYREEHYFEIIKKAAIIVGGIILFVCLPGIMYATAILPVGFGAPLFIDAFILD